MKARVLALALGGILGVEPLAGAARDETSESFAYATYRERQGHVTVLLDSLPASYRDAATYVPIPIAIGLQEYGREITVNPETFTLIDQAGRRYPAASYAEVVERYPFLIFDGGFVAGRPITAQQFELSRRLPSSFYPFPGEEARIGRVHLAAYTWLRDVIYFPHPDAGLGGVLTLRISGGGIDPPMEVRFRVPLEGVRVP